MPVQVPSLTDSQHRALGGFKQRIANPANPASAAQSMLASSNHSIHIDLDHATTAYSFYVPDGAFIKAASVYLSPAFSPGATLDIGTTLSGNDIIPGIDLTQVSISFPAVPLLSSALINTPLQSLRKVFLTMSGSPSVGSGHLVVEYFNTK